MLLLRFLKNETTPFSSILQSKNIVFVAFFYSPNDAKYSSFDALIRFNPNDFGISEIAALKRAFLSNYQSIASLFLLSKKK